MQRAEKNHYAILLLGNELGGGQERMTPRGYFHGEGVYYIATGERL